MGGQGTAERMWRIVFPILLYVLFSMLYPEPLRIASGGRMSEPAWAMWLLTAVNLLIFACVLFAVSTRKERVQEKTFLLFKGYASSDSWFRMPFQRDKLFFGFNLSASSLSGVSGSVGRNLSL